MRTNQLSDEEFRKEVGHRLDEWNRRVKRITTKIDEIERKIVQLKAEEIARRKADAPADE